MENNSSTKKRFQGIVCSDKNDKTVVVSVKSLKSHKKYRKKVTSHKKFTAHDAKNECKTGNIVEIEESAPISKMKRWKVIKIISQK